MLDRSSSLQKMTTFGPPDAGLSRIESDANGRAIFWGEISPCEHLVQIYKDDEVFLDALEGFVSGGIKAGDGVIVIATPPHLAVLERRLLTRGIDVGLAASRDQYIALDAHEAMETFLVNGWVDKDLFSRFVTDLVNRAGGRMAGSAAGRASEHALTWGDHVLSTGENVGGGVGGGGRRVRAFGEMVAVLWAQGNKSATIRLEYLWHEFCQRNAFCLFCAYPRACFTQDAESSIKQICDAHSRVVMS